MNTENNDAPQALGYTPGQPDGDKAMREPDDIAREMLNRLNTIKADPALDEDVTAYLKELNDFHRDLTFIVTTQSEGLMLGVSIDREAIQHLSVLCRSIATLAFAAGRKTAVAA